MKKAPLILFILLPLVLLAQPMPVIKQETIPGSTVGYKMALIPGGKFTMGSPETEKGRGSDEGLHEVTLDSFWIGVCEVTFDEFFLFQFRSSDSDASAMSGFSADAVARPSPPYYDFTYGRGKAGGYPATTMTLIPSR
ncbi:MAG: formylglycine-generating enzyme family protein [Bacteroidota bacterium]